MPTATPSRVICITLPSVPVARGAPRTCTASSFSLAASSSRSKTRGLMFGPRYSTGPSPSLVSPNCFFSLEGVSLAWHTSTAMPTAGSTA